MSMVDRSLSRSLFAIWKGRANWLRFKNKIKTFLGKFPVAGIQNQDAAGKFQQLLSQGYDKFNIGGGGKNLKGFINIDFVPRPEMERFVVADILDLSFIPDEAASHVHSNHVLEHLAEDEITRQIKTYFRILKKGGLLTLRVPNALGAAYGFWHSPILEKDREAFVAMGWPEDEDFAPAQDYWMHRSLFGLFHWFHGDVGNITNQHLTLITPSRFSFWVKEAGFNLCRMSEPEALNLVVVARKE